MVFGIKFLDREVERFLTSERGVTMMELLVAVTLFGVVGGSLAIAMTSTLRDLGREYRLASATESLRMAMNVISAELKMAAHASPYLPGINTSAVNCTDSIDVSDTSLKYLITLDDPTSAAGGLRSSYVGYSYDPLTETLFRGEVASAGNYSCAVPAADPISPVSRSPIAQKVIPVDYDSDGTDDPIFAIDRTNLTVTMGIQVLGKGGQYITQRLQTVIDMRNSDATT